MGRTMVQCNFLCFHKNHSLPNCLWKTITPADFSWEKKSTNNCAEQLLEDRDSTINAFKENLLLAHNRMRKQADLCRKELNFQVEDEVFLKLRPYRQPSLARKNCEKLSSKFYGRYRIVERIGEVAWGGMES